MDIVTLVRSAKPRLIEIARLAAGGKQAEAVAAFRTLVNSLPRGSDPRLPKLLAGLVVSSVRAQQQRPRLRPRVKFEDPLTAFEDPLTAFEDPLTAFEDPLTAFGDPASRRLAQALLKGLVG